MADQPTEHDRSRRGFLKTAGTATLGAFVLSACGREASDGFAASASTPLPSGFRFYPIDPTGIDGLPGDLELSPLVMLNNVGQLLMYASFGERYGLFEVPLDLGGGAPDVGRARVALQTGTELADGRRVDSIDSVDFNDDGTIAAVIGTDGEINTDRLPLMAPGVYLSREQSDFEYRAGLGDPAPDNGGTLGGVFGDLALGNNDNLLITAMFSDRDPSSTASVDTVFSGLFYLPSATLSEGRDLINSSSTLSGTNGNVSQFGIVDVNSGGDFVAQAFVDNRDQALSAMLAGTDDPSAGSFVIGGSTGGARGTFGIVRPTAAKAATPGDIYFGPRVALDGRRAIVEHFSDDDAVLYLGDDVVARTGDSSPKGQVIKGLSAPVMGPDGLLFYLLTLEDGFELCVTNGSSQATVLSSGDRLGGKRIVTAAHGYHSDQADSEARIVFYGEFDDGSEAIIVGVPE